jgi:polysaccharide pyruvyl transferase WcaK-like protein
LERFASFTSAMPELVADCAFMMAPSWPDPIVSRWIEERRKRSDKILGFNLHPMLVKEDPASVAGLVASAAEALEPILARGDTAIVLMPHDRRVGVGDSSMLEAIYHRMVSRHSEALLLLDPATLSAAQLKSIAGSLDGVVTGRMHLAIGALGMGVPVLCVGYQDKFEGLFAHFGMPEAMLMDAAAAGDPAVLNRRLSAFIDRLPELRVMVGDALPAVLARSRRNFAGLEAICN